MITPRLPLCLLPSLGAATRCTSARRHLRHLRPRFPPPPSPPPSPPPPWPASCSLARFRASGSVALGAGTAGRKAWISCRSKPPVASSSSQRQKASLARPEQPVVPDEAEKQLVSQQWRALRWRGRRAAAGWPGPRHGRRTPRAASGAASSSAPPAAAATAAAAAAAAIGGAVGARARLGRAPPCLLELD